MNNPEKIRRRNLPFSTSQSPTMRTPVAPFSEKPSSTSLKHSNNSLQHTIHRSSRSWKNQPSSRRPNLKTLIRKGSGCS